MNNNIDKEKIIKQLDYWENLAREQSTVFREINMLHSAHSSEGMAQAYWNVKQFIEENF